MIACTACGRTVHDVGQLCHLCTGRLRRHLLDVPDLLAELETTALRQASTGQGRGGDAIPYDQRARDTQHALVNSVSTWCRVLLGDDGDPGDVRPTPAAWLADHTGRIRMQPWARDCLADIDQTVTSGWAAVDQPTQRWYAGLCDTETIQPDGTAGICGRTLWARIDHPQVTCPGCRSSRPVADRRDWLLRAAQDRHESAPAIASMLTLMFRRRISPATIRWWASADGGRQLTPVGQRGTARLYRIGDVLTLVQRQGPDAPVRRELTAARGSPTL